jgi:hypothetical protein
MSMISRYKKKGGFLQLLNLMETSGAAKQEKFLKLIEEEDARWSEAIKTKMLTVKKIFSWDDNTVAEIVARLNDLTVATALHGLDEAAKEKSFKMMAQARKKKIEDIMKEKVPNTAEISTIFVQILTEVRSLIAQGYIYIEKIDPNLVVDSAIEEKLSQSTLFTMGQETTSDKSTPAASGYSQPHLDAPAHKSSAKDSGEVEALKRRLNQLLAENTHLKEKLMQAESKLANIRKYAA